jgi:hypothetical protein
MSILGYVHSRINFLGNVYLGCVVLVSVNVPRIFLRFNLIQIIKSYIKLGIEKGNLVLKTAMISLYLPRREGNSWSFEGNEI